MTQPAESFNDIAPTAFLAAYWRQFSGTPYAQEVFDAAAEVWTGYGQEMPNLYPQRTYRGPTMEARHRVGNILLARAGNTQTLDLAAGLSVRGLQHTAAHQDSRYVELDLPIMSRVKQDTLARLGTSALGVQYWQEPGSALDPEAIERAVNHFDPARQVSVFCEGFLHYLDDAERAQVAANVATVLRRFGGVWITDLPHHPDAETAAIAPRFHAAGTNRNVSELAFPNRQAALTFFTGQGFNAPEEEAFGYELIVDQLVSPTRLGLTRDEVAAQQRPWGMHVLRLAA
ncbi:MAG TPA: class I SAM-dependent methyltransferase [Bacillota bacterium]|nr:class I SAM-dependent methyltransferase [Bacillota bacterium]